MLSILIQGQQIIKRPLIQYNKEKYLWLAIHILLKTILFINFVLN